jgi:hypothetical protein
MSKVIHHVLPGEENGDLSWFYRQNQFERREILRQVAFKRKHWPEAGNGKFAKLPQHTCPHIFPDDYSHYAYYEPIAGEINNYLESEDIAIHNETLNLKSSQVACLNFLFPFRLDLFLATKIFKSILPGLYKVNNIEFEYTGDLDVTKWLGEPLSGKRGQHRTSIDAALFWDDDNLRRHATLIEWKYTEPNFGVCSSFSKSNRKGKAICKSINVAKDDHPAQRCQLTNGRTHRSRRYWERMENAGISLRAFSKVEGCPFRGPLYQLMRQFLLGVYLVENKIVDQFEIVAMHFAGNRALHRIPRHLQPMVQEDTESVIDIWNKSLLVKNKVRQITVEDFMKQVDKVGIIEANWREYIAERYGV